MVIASSQNDTTNSRVEGKTHSPFETKMAKINTLFRTKSSFCEQRYMPPFLPTEDVASFTLFNNFLGINY